MNQNNQPLIKVLITLVIIATVTAALLIITSGESSDDNVFLGKTFGTCCAFLFYGITGGICWATARKKEYAVLSYAGLAISGLAFILATVVIMDEEKEAETIKLMLTSMVAAIGITQICFLFYITAQNTFTTTARMIATIAIAAYSLLLISKIYSAWDDYFWMQVGIEKYMKAIVALFVIGLGSCLLVPLCNQLFTKKPPTINVRKDQSPASHDPHQPGV